MRPARCVRSKKCPGGAVDHGGAVSPLPRRPACPPNDCSLAREPPKPPRGSSAHPPEGRFSARRPRRRGADVASTRCASSCRRACLEHNAPCCCRWRPRTGRRLQRYRAPCRGSRHCSSSQPRRCVTWIASTCFYLDRATDPYQGRKRIMSPATLERLVSGYLAYSFPISAFSFQGGDPASARGTRARRRHQIVIREDSACR